VSNAKPLVYALNDSLMLLAPSGWGRVELGLARTPQGLRVTDLQTKGEGAKEPKPKPNLFVEPREEAQRLGEALTELEKELEGKWRAGRVMVERPSSDFVDWKFLREDGSVAWFTRLEKSEVQSLLITDDLFSAVSGTERAFHDLQGQLQQRLGKVTGFAYDPAHGVLRLDRPQGPLELSAQVVGSYLPDVFTWMWSWSDENAQAASSGRVKRVCQPDLKPDGLAAFWRPHFHCDEGFSWALAGHVAVSLGARGLFRAQPPDADGALFFAILELPPVTAQA
jgi:hypothetical protein